MCYRPLYFNRKSGGLKHHHEPGARLDAVTLTARRVVLVTPWIVALTRG